jgi:hypothetical protein
VEVTGELRLSGARIGGQLALAAAKLINNDCPAFAGNGVSTTGDAVFGGADEADDGSATAKIAAGQRPQQVIVVVEASSW